MIDHYELSQMDLRGHAENILHECDAYLEYMGRMGRKPKTIYIFENQKSNIETAIRAAVRRGPRPKTLMKHSEWTDFINGEVANKLPWRYRGIPVMAQVGRDAA